VAGGRGWHSATIEGSCPSGKISKLFINRPITDVEKTPEPITCLRLLGRVGVQNVMMSRRVVQHALVLRPGVAYPP